jgi:single-strand DNA-binding protein
MSTFQQVTIVGHLGDDPHIHQFENGIMAQMSIATTENWKDKQTQEKKSRTEWHRVIVNGKRAEVIEKYVKKGDKLLVVGKLRTRKWTDQSGAEKYTTEIVVDDFKFMSSKNSTMQGQSNSVGHSGNQFLENNGAPSTSSSVPDDDDDLPF